MSKMNSLLRIRASSRSCAQIVRAYSSTDEHSPWFRDNKPGPYPKTEEEKIAAAKKYGLLREEYEPYPDDGNGCGDYPKLPAENVESRDPYYPWTSRYFRRNFNDVLHVDEMFYTYGRITDERLRYSPLFMFSAFLGFVGFFAVCIVVLGDYKYHQNVMEKQYPQPGVVHYLFDQETERRKH